MRRLKRVVGLVLLLLFGTMALGVAAGIVLTRTRIGQDFVRSQAVERIADALNGELRVREIRSRQLFLGGTFVDVVITDADGRPFLVADSIELSYSIPGLLAGQIRFPRMIAYQPRITLERLPHHEAFNVMRIFAGDGGNGATDEAAEASPGDAEPRGTTPRPHEAPERLRSGPGRADASGTRVAFRNLEIRGGRIDVVYPLAEGAPPPARGLWETLPGVDGRVRRIVFADVDAVLDEMRLVDPAFPGPLFVVERLSTNVTLFDDPLEIQSLSGTAAWQEDGIEIELDRLFLPDSEAAATAFVEFGESGPVVRADIDAWLLALRDVQWAAPMLPGDAVGEAQLALTIGPGLTQVRWADADLTMSESRLTGEGMVSLGDQTTLDGVDMQLQPLDLAHVRPYLPDRLAIDGTLRGRVRLAGPLAGPWVSAQVTLDQLAQDRAPTLADVTGIVHLDGSPGVTDLTAVLEPVQLDVLTDLAPGLGIGGPGAIRLDASGRLDSGLRFDALVQHRPVDLPASTVQGSGTVTGGEDGLAFDVEASLEPLSFTAWRAYRPDLPVSGEVRGSVSVAGPLSRITVVSDLETVAGSMSLEATFDARDPLASYRLSGDLEQFRLSELLEELPDPSTVTARFDAEGSGIDAASARGAATVHIQDSRLGELLVDTAAAMIRLADGFLHVDTVTASTSVMDVRGAGALALDDSLGAGEIHASFESASLEGLRPFFMGDSLIARDTLSVLEREMLIVEGVDPDTLPERSEILVDGSAEGALVVTGSLRRFGLRAEATLDDVQYGGSFLRRARVSLSAEGLPSGERVFSGTLDADSASIVGRDFRRGRLAGELRSDGGRVEIRLERTETESYAARGTFERDSAATVLNLDQLALQFGERRWNLGGPSRLTWGDGLIDVRDFRLHRPDGEGMDLRLHGRMARGVEDEMTLGAEAVPLGTVARLLQLDAELEGVVDVDVRIRGLPSSPTIRGSVGGDGVGYESIRLDRVDGSVDYADRRVVTDWTAATGGRTVLEASGTVPIDLALVPVDRRVPDERMDLSIAVDSFPAGLALGVLESFEQVEGSLTGRFTVGGTIAAPAPSGSVRLADGSALIPDLGVRHTNVQADLDLTPDGTVAVEGTVQSAGTMAVSGTVRLDTLSNPYLDLTAGGAGFLAADRADVLATIGGEVHVEGRYRRPLVSGSVNVESGALYLDEVRRTSELVDLSDLSFLAVVDTAASPTQPLIDFGENPFLRNLRLDTTLRLSRNFWLRSVDMNVEIEGDLMVFYDRTRRDLAMLGELQAVRGTYSRFGRQFQIQEGTVRFVGTPGLDPDLDIVAVNRLRVRDGEPLNIFATLEGTLLDPRVTLTSDAQPAIAQSELVSYLIFGRPTYELASNEFGLVQGEFGGLFGSAAGAGASLAFGALGTQLGSAVAQEIGLDYFAISQAQGATALGTGFESAFRFTQVEVGWYVAQDVFLALLLRPLLGINSAGISGARLEWRMTDLWTVEGFLEDRFARDLNTGFSVNEAFQVPKIWGLFLAREWGY